MSSNVSNKDEEKNCSLPKDVWKSNEFDCGPPKIIRPFVMLKLDGYSSEEAIDDYPTNIHISKDYFKWIYDMGNLWHRRLDFASRISQEAHSFSKTLCEDSSVCKRAQSLTLVVPNKKFFGESVDGYPFPSTMIEMIKKAKNVQYLCLVILQFSETMESEHCLHFFHVKTVIKNQFLISLKNRSLKDNENESVRKAWSLGSSYLYGNIKSCFEDPCLKWYHLLSTETRQSINKRAFDGMRDPKIKPKRQRLVPIERINHFLKSSSSNCIGKRLINYYGKGNGMPPIFTTYKEES